MEAWWATVLGPYRVRHAEGLRHGGTHRLSGTAKWFRTQSCCQGCALISMRCKINACLVLSRNPGKYFCNIVSFLFESAKWRSPWFF